MDLIIGIAVTVFSFVIIGGLKWLANVFKRESKETRNEIKYIAIELQATDHAIGRSLGNGYAGYKKEKLEELLDKEKFIRGEI